ncbi:hydrolase [soil metagenome]
MGHSRLLSRSEAVLLVVDVQESFRKHIADFAIMTKNISILVESSKVLDLPVIVTEQYPQGLGNTVAEIKACLGAHEQFDKSCFSCCQSEEFLSGLAKTGRKQVIVTGIEAHVCVSQTVHDLLEKGYIPHIIVDAIGSRSPKNKEIGIEKMVSSGAIMSCVEMALFEMLCKSGTDEFKAIQRLVK